MRAHSANYHAIGYKSFPFCEDLVLKPLLFAALLALPVVSDASAPKNPAPFGDSAPTATLTPGDAVPNFSLTNVDGTTVNLTDLRGKVVVLEFFNPDCPFIVHGHGEGPLATLPSKWTKKGVEWLVINSNRPGSQGAGVERNQRAKAEYKLPTPVFWDETSAVARAFDAKVTPELFILDPKGQLAYAGGPDNAPRGKAPDNKLRIFADEVLEAMTAGKPAPYTRQKAYGCSVKY